MAKTIHQHAIMNHYRRNIRGRSSYIDAKSAQLFVEILGIFPKLFSQIGLACSDIKRFQNRRHHHRRERTTANVRMRGKNEILHRLFGSRDESAKRDKV